MSNDYALPDLQTAYHDGSEDMTPLLKEVLDAHGGLTQWKQFTKISATIRSRGNLWEMKGVPQDPSPGKCPHRWIRSGPRFFHTALQTS
jgi:hypothetical protein